MSALETVQSSDIVARLISTAPRDATWVFDCDGTLINGDIASHTAWGMLRRGLVSSKLLPKDFRERFYRDPFDFKDFLALRLYIAEAGGDHHSSVYEWEARMHTGHALDTIVRVAEEMIEHGRQIGTLHFTRPLSELAQKVAGRAWICSGSPQSCVLAVADRLGIARERTIGTMLETVDGVFGEKMLPPGVIWEDTKRIALEQKGVVAPWFAAGDSIGDWQMIEMSIGWRWCIVWDQHRHRGEEMRQIVQERVLGTDATLPTEPGIYCFQKAGKNWILEVKAPS